MKKVAFAVAVALVFAMSSFAQEAKKETKKEAKAVAKAHAPEFTGVITALDAAKSTVTIKNSKGEEKSFITTTAKVVTADKAVATLVDLKVGEKVKIAYTEDAGNFTATKIAHVTEKAKTPAPAAEKK